MGKRRGIGVAGAVIYIGLPQWQHGGWSRFGMRTLADYARYFNCVEGNTTLYALPDARRVLEWRAMTTDDFRFCLKFPAAISHQGGLRDFHHPLAQFFLTLEPLAERIGQYWLQLPAAFAPADLPALWTFLDALPVAFHYGVEVRHPQFFAKGEEERQLNRGLHQRGVNRVILDSRPVHSARSGAPALLAAQRKKPKVPVHAVLTAERPLIRYIGSDDFAESLQLFQPWLERLPHWLCRHTPFLFIHTPDIAHAPSLAQALWPMLAEKLPDIGSAPVWPQQDLLF
ncbi:DUF72 domain-containing protein [Martelella alba]|uniref:DUF72 domain-containing protein n=1 Tax=Martelella alba TaxID=2590451 RepID=A0ABY2SRP2_9HYPH|nr:DUF72 domain-containing protein [Martelella alba]TKI08248.1 DUF72 domain-containing protein [Martelella alba]